MFLKAADELGVGPEESAVLEDAGVGVQAGRRGNFGIVVGVARHGDEDMLRRHGADRVVHELTELDGEF
jgi:beta-phosphoglucomutase-like phosphatase (HAD superfamily)